MRELSGDIHSKIFVSLDRSDKVQVDEELCKTVIEAFPESAMADEYRDLAKAVMAECGMEVEIKKC